MLPIDTVIKDRLVVWEDIFKPKEFKVLEKPRLKFFGKWKIETPEGDIIEYDKGVKLQQIIGDLEAEGYIKRERFYVFGIDGIYFASSQNSGSWIKLPYSPNWDKVSEEFFHSRVSFIRASVRKLREEYPDVYASVLYKDLIRKVHKTPFIVYHL